MATKIVDLRASGQKSDKDLPKNTTVLHVDYTDPDTEMTYGGDFTVKRLNMADIRQVAIRKAQLNGGIAPDLIEPGMSYFNSMLAHLEVALVQTPEWWKPDEFYNADVINDVYQEVMSFEDSFRRADKQQPQENKSSGEGATESDPAHAEAVVGEEVQAAANVG